MQTGPKTSMTGRMMLAMVAVALQAPAAFAASGDVVATVNGVALHREEVDEAMVGRQASARPEVLQGLIARELLRQAAERDGLGNAQPVRAAMQKAKIDTENRLFVANHLSVQQVTDDEVRRRYDEIVSQLGPYEYKVSRMSFPDEPTARFALMLLENGESVPNIVGRTQATDADTRWVSFKSPVKEGQTQGLPLPLAQIVATMKVGEKTRVPVRIGDTFAIARLEDRRETTVPSFADAKEAMRKAVASKKGEDAFAALIAQLAQNAVIRPAGLVPSGATRSESK